MLEQNKLHKKKITVLLLAPVILTPILCLMFGLLFAKDASKEDLANAKKGFSFSLPQSTSKDSGNNKVEAERFEKEALQKEHMQSFTTGDLQQSNNPLANTSAIDNLIASVDKKNQSNATQPTNQELTQLNDKYNSLYNDKSQRSNTTNHQNNLTPNDIPTPQNLQAVNNSQYANQPSYSNKTSSDVNKSFGKPSNEKRIINRRFGTNLQQTESNTSSSKMIGAIFHGDQKVMSQDGRVEMRLLEAFKYQDIEIPANSRLYGLAKGAVSTNRLAITITSFIYNGKQYNVSWDIYDVDGNKGVNVPNSGLKVRQNLNEGGAETISEADRGINQALGSNTDLKSAGIKSGANIISGLARRGARNKIQNINVHLNNEYRIFINTKSN
jgi:Conjugative transposon, TraM